MGNEKGPAPKDSAEPVDPTNPGSDKVEVVVETPEDASSAGDKRDRARNGGGRGISIGRKIKNYLN